MKEEENRFLELMQANRPQAEESFRLGLRQKVLAANQSNTDSQTKGFLRQFRVQLSIRQVTYGVLLALVLLLLTPPGRTFAEQIFRLGVFVVTRNATLVERWIDNPQIGVTVTSQSSLVEASSTASAQAGFSVYYPRFLPPGYLPGENPPIGLIRNAQGKFDAAEAMFRSADGKYILYLSQHPFPPDATLDSMPLAVGDATVQKTKVSGYDALWLVDYDWGTETNSAGTSQPVKYNLLLWTLPAENGAKYYFWLGSQEKLPLNVMLNVAESITVP